ncbi:MAG: glycoside hydrolase family 3 C-terminal domain-containing protein [Bacilli bacterium]|nr:glycoside hydrolase family 3 C-terminal domain-containing protein [Bacilli bacterium]
MKKKLLLLGILPILGMGVGATNAVHGEAGRIDRFFSDIGNDKTKYCQKAMDLNARIADEGVVLLKNANNFLPMAKASKVSLAGKSSVSLVRGGAGSGAGSVSQGITEIKMVGSLESAGLVVNKTLSSFYEDNSKSGNGRTNGNTGWKGISEVTIGETDLSKYPSNVLASMDEYNDAAIFVISREGSEGCDVKTCNAHDSQKDPKPISKRHALEMSINEEALFNELKQHTENIIIVVNSGNAYECDVFEKDPAVKAVLWMGTPGANGAGAIGRILVGDVNPSGKTVDTWTRDFTLDPSFKNFSDNAQNNLVTDANGNEIYAPADTLFNADGSPVRSDGSYKGAPKWSDQKNKVVEYGLNGVRPSAFLNYEEGIYVDYRYYETAYADMLAVKGKDAADEWYNGAYGVVYPFGYGLSYTTFNQEIVKCDIADKTIDINNRNVHVNMEVKVTNTGNVAGKDAVQVYFKAPYIDGEIEKAYNNLCGIGKTGLLNPGESETVKVDFYLQDVASYDFNDANNNNFCGYELDAGTYNISLNKNAHEEYGSVSFRISEGIQYKEDRYTGYTVENRFTNNGFYSSLPSEDDFEFTQMSRSDFEDTFPTAPTIGDRTLGDASRVQEFFTHRFTMADVEESTTWEYVPEAVHKTKDDIEALGWEQASSKVASSARTLKFSDMVGVSLDDPKWDELLNQFTWEEMEQFVDGASHNPSVSEIGKPETNDSDGPSKFRIMWWCGGPIVAATFNERLAKEQGDCVGMEAHIENTYGWAGPGVNIHRSPFGGRNFEYYSGDPFLTGRIAGRVVEGATDKGIYCFFKHFAVNDQEKHREGVACFLTEQALREIYLKPFQMCIQEGKSTGIMSSYNRLGLMETAASYPLLTEVLRNEWGFKGSIISDMTHHGNSAFDAGMYENINNRLLAGCNNQLDGDDYSNDMNCKWNAEANDGKGAPVYKNASGDTVESYSWWYAVRNCCKECLYMCANCGAMSSKFDGIDTGMTFSNTVNNRLVANVGESIETEFVVGEFDYIEDLQIDPATPLPEGLTFDSDRIYGTVDKPVNTFIRVIFKDDLENVYGNTLNLTVLATPQIEAASIGEEKPVEEPEKSTPAEEKKGCGGSVVAASALVSLIAMAGAGLMLLRRKEK